jgi:hypothetical protein
VSRGSRISVAVRPAGSQGPGLLGRGFRWLARARRPCGALHHRAASRSARERHPTCSSSPSPPWPLPLLLLAYACAPVPRAMLQESCSTRLRARPCLAHVRVRHYLTRNEHQELRAPGHRAVGSCSVRGSVAPPGWRLKRAGRWRLGCRRQDSAGDKADCHGAHACMSSARTGSSSASGPQEPPHSHTCSRPTDPALKLPTMGA